MTLYDYMKSHNEELEITVWDENYDIETYFYNEENLDDVEDLDLWDEVMIDLSKLLMVKTIHDNGVVVNFSEVIENHLENLKKANLFRRCNVDSIMDGIEFIISGYVSAEWLEDFVDELKI